MTVAGLGAVVARDAPAAFDRRGLRFVTGWPDWLEPPLAVAMQMGALFGAVSVALVVRTVSQRFRPVSASISIVAAWIVVRVAKDLLARPRPTSIDAGRALRASATSYSYPSGHAAVAMALAVSVVVSSRSPWRWVAVGVAFLTAIARVYLGVHFPSDVIGGAAVGASIALVAHTVTHAGASTHRSTSPSE